MASIRNTLVVGIATAAIGLGMGWGIASAQVQRQPHMENALGFLQSARNALQNATADKGGHRQRAIAQVDQAIAETRAGIAFDNRR